MRIGYACINLSMECRSSRTFRLKSYSAENMRSTVAGNLSCLREQLDFNLEHCILYFRISSDLVPFASHPVCAYPWQREF
ncbi:MAG: UV DNA damage repair endonuclease UvsE, partial [Actinomycetota bacterium]|nr:UV DNA damage repair endonuclease UvsE [Actinomycetota bacterium]